MYVQEWIIISALINILSKPIVIEDSSSKIILETSTNDKVGQDESCLCNSLEAITIEGSKELSVNLRQKVIDCYKAGKSHGNIFACLGVPRSTVHSAINKFVKFGAVEILIRVKL